MLVVALVIIPSSVAGYEAILIALPESLGYLLVCRIELSSDSLTSAFSPVQLMYPINFFFYAVYIILST